MNVPAAIFITAMTSALLIYLGMRDSITPPYLTVIGVFAVALWSGLIVAGVEGLWPS